MPTLKWAELNGNWFTRIPAKDVKGRGEYEIVVAPRVRHCDRGRWIASVWATGVLPLDGQEGFPRYYFDLERAKAELQDWANAREEIRAAVTGGRG